VVLFGPSPDAVRVVRGLRLRGVGGPLFGGPELASEELVAELGDVAAGLTVVAPCDLGRPDPRPAAFADRYRAAYGGPPTVRAAYGYDAVHLVIRAVREAGLDRAAIRDALAATGGFDGVTGPIRFDGTGATTARPVLLRVADGRFVAVGGARDSDGER
jgi:branched-chain amino acid transport system substrate-binding protein